MQFLTPPVLHSNAEQAYPHLPTRVLQPHSGNSQASTPSSLYKPDIKLHDILETENHHTFDQTSRPPVCVPSIPPYPRHHSSLRARACLRITPFDYSLEEEEAELREAHKLHERWLHYPGYKKYRDGINKEDADESKWPDHAEIAFIRGLIRHHPRGRCQVRYRNKPQGRNESISATIEELIGETRDRKMISSHIQVVKKWFAGDPYIMSYFDIKDTATRQRNKILAQHATRAAGPVAADICARSEYAPVQSSSAVLEGSYSWGHPDRPSNLDAFQPTDFHMFLQKTEVSPETGEISARTIHTYSRHLDHDLPSFRKEPVLDWEGKYSHLYDLLGNQPPSCNVLIGNVSIDLPHISKHDGSGINLCVSLSCSTNIQPGNFNWTSRLRLIGFEDIIGELPVRSRLDQTFEQIDSIVWSHGEPGSHLYDTQLKFGSGLWAKCLGKLPSLLKTPPGPTMVDNYLKHLVVLQEIYVHEGHHPQDSDLTFDTPACQRVLVLYWRFRLGPGSTVWHRLVPAPVMHGRPASDVMETESHTVTPSGHLEHDSMSPLPRSSYPGGYQYERVSELIPRQSSLQSPFEYDCHSAASATSITTWPSTDAALTRSSNTYPAAGVPFEFADVPVDTANLDFSEFDAVGTSFDIQITGDFGTEYAGPSYSQPHSDAGDATVWSYPSTYSQGVRSAAQHSFDTHTSWDSQEHVYQHQPQHHDTFQQYNGIWANHSAGGHTPAASPEDTDRQGHRIFSGLPDGVAIHEAMAIQQGEEKVTAHFQDSTVPTASDSNGVTHSEHQALPGAAVMRRMVLSNDRRPSDGSDPAHWL